MLDPLELGFQVVGNPTQVLCRDKCCQPSPLLLVGTVNPAGYMEILGTWECTGLCPLPRPYCVIGTEHLPLCRRHRHRPLLLPFLRDVLCHRGWP